MADKNLYNVCYRCFTIIIVSVVMIILVHDRIMVIKYEMNFVIYGRREISMEIYELAITDEEFRNYHNFYSKLAALNLTDWIKAYINTIIYVILICTVVSLFSEKLLLMYWYNTNIFIKLVSVFIIFIFAALQRSRNIQMSAMFQKYFISNVPQEFLDGKVQLKKVKVHGNRLLVYYRKFND